jgi:ribonuclease BN (tRNA processing enzyme)
MKGLCFIPLGVGDAFSALSYSSCLAVGLGDRWLLIDCPHPVRKMLREASDRTGIQLDLDRVEAVALSHLHADHSSGLESAAYFCKYALGCKLTVIAHPEVTERLWSGHLAGVMGWSRPAPGQPVRQKQFEEYFDLRPVTEQLPANVGPFTMECFPTLHSIPTTAFRVRAGGRCLGCSADTGFDPALVDWLSAADVIVHETGHSVWHTSYEKLAGLHEALRQRMRLIHYPDNFDQAENAIDTLKQGMVYPV